MSSEPTPTPIDRDQAVLNAMASLPDMTSMITCAACGRQRTLADDYDYSPLQLFTGRALGWFNGDGEQMCGGCLVKTMRGQMP
jgi:hypothetical protein